MGEVERREGKYEKWRSMYMHKKKERKRKGRSKREQYWVRKTKVEKMNK